MGTMCVLVSFSIRNTSPLLKLSSCFGRTHSPRCGSLLPNSTGFSDKGLPRPPFSSNILKLPSPLPPRNSSPVSSSMKASRVPLWASRSAVPRAPSGRASARGSQTISCRLKVFEKPTETSRFCVLAHSTFCGLVPWWAWTSAHTAAVRGSTTRKRLSLLDVQICPPSKLKSAEKIWSVWHSMDTWAAPLSTSHSLRQWSIPAVASTWLAEGWNRSTPTFLLWPAKVRVASVRFPVRPPEGMDQSRTVVSSEPVAMRLSSKGWKAQSSTGAVWPARPLGLEGSRPSCSKGCTTTLPAPVEAQARATYLLFAARRLPTSHTLELIRMSLYWASARAGSA
eukprot:RCo020910